MEPTVLLEKLVNIERFIGVEPDSVIRLKVIEVEACVLAMQEERARSRRRRMFVASGGAARGTKQQGAVSETRDRSATPYLAWSNPSMREKHSQPPACA
jgi:hypothetical protein